MFGKIKRMQGNELTVEVEDIDLYKLQRLSDDKMPTVELTVNDNRRISPEQRAKIYALINDLCSYTGDVPDYWKDFFKSQVKDLLNLEELSLSDCSVTAGNYLILTILNFLFEEDIPFKSKIWDSIPDDFPKQALCLKNKRCVICGKRAQIAHYDAVGVGRNRYKISHVGKYIMMLCAEHHKKQHDIGVSFFTTLYHIKPIKVTTEIAKKLKLGRVSDE